MFCVCVHLFNKRKIAQSVWRVKHFGAKYVKCVKHFGYFSCCNRAIYLPKISNSMFATLPTLMLQKLVLSWV